MTKQILYNAEEHVAASGTEESRQPFQLIWLIYRLTWVVCWATFYRLSPRPFHSWRAMLLRIFGARMGPSCHFYPTSKVWAPCNLTCEDRVTAGDGAEIYNPAPVRLNSHAIMSQNSYLCGASRDFENPGFTLLAHPMEVGRYAWICARACVGPGIKVGEGAVLGLSSVATRDLDPWGVYGGAPAVKIKERKRVH